MEHSSGGFGKAQELCIDPVKDQTSVVSKPPQFRPALEVDEMLKKFPVD
jgi:hypothetical protein